MENQPIFEFISSLETFKSSKELFLASEIIRKYTWFILHFRCLG